MKNNNYVEKEIEKNLLLTPEEIRSLNEGNDSSIAELQQFIFNLSIVLYKSFKNED